MSLQAPMSRIPIRNRNASASHKRTISAPSKLEQMQMALQARIEKEKQEKLSKDKEERMLALYREEQERNNRQISKYGYNKNNVARAKQGGNVGGVRQFLQERRYDQNSAGKGVRGKPPLPHQKNSAGRDRGNPLAPINHRSPQLGYNDVGVLGQGGSPTGLRHSPKPGHNIKGRGKLGRPQRGPYGTPNDSGNESSGYEDQNQNRVKNKYQKRPARLNQYQASSEEDVATTPPRKPSSFQKWKQERSLNNKIPRSTAIHNGYNSDGPVSDYQKWQGEMDREREDRLRLNREKDRESPAGAQEDFPSARSHRGAGGGGVSEREAGGRRRSQPSTARYESEEDDDPPPRSNRSNVSKISASAMERNAKLEAELKRKEQELLDMIQKQQQELEAMKVQRQQDEAEEEREVKQRAEEQERRRREREADERQRQRSRHSDVYVEEKQHMPSPPPASMPKPIARKARRVKPPPPARKAPPPAPPADNEPSFFDTSNAAEFYHNMAADPNAAPVNLNLVPCSLCGRKFAAERLSKHQVACQKAQKAATKRKVFDPVKMRTEGTELAQYAGAAKVEPKKKDNGDWRRKHEDFINTIRYAKKVTEMEKQGGKLADLPPPPRTENAHYKQCPYCERRFAPDTADRHIPRCKDIKARPAPPDRLKRRGR